MPSQEKEHRQTSESAQYNKKSEIYIYIYKYIYIYIYIYIYKISDIPFPSFLWPFPLSGWIQFMFHVGSEELLSKMFLEFLIHIDALNRMEITS